jgi:hypothetical protein
MTVFVKVRRVTNGTTMFDWFKRIGCIELKVFKNDVGPFRYDPLMEWEATSVEGNTTSVHKATE